MAVGRRAASEPVTVHKLDAAGREVRRYPGRTLRVAPDRIVLEAEFGHPPTEAGGLRMEPGDRFVETFYLDRWYNVFAVYQGPGPRLRGWYCNIARPARVEAGDVYAEDLALDLIVLPDGTSQVLDRDEFDVLSLSHQDRERALQSLADLTERVERGEEPFLLPG